MKQGWERLVLYMSGKPDTPPVKSNKEPSHAHTSYITLLPWLSSFAWYSKTKQVSNQKQGVVASSQKHENLKFPGTIVADWQPKGGGSKWKHINCLLTLCSLSDQFAHFPQSIDLFAFKQLLVDSIRKTIFFPCLPFYRIQSVWDNLQGSTNHSTNILKCHNTQGRLFHFDPLCFRFVFI